jgi:hypothetical protein
MTAATFNGPIQCGSCGSVIPAGVPFYRVTKALLPRCSPCANQIGGAVIDAPEPPQEPQFISPLAKWAHGKMLDYKARQSGE